MTLLIVTVPPESVESTIPPFTVVGAISETSPVIVPVDVEVTVTFTVAAVPCVMGAGVVDPLTVRAVVVAWKVPTASGHCVARLATFTEPRPVARSYPVAAVQAGVVVEAGRTSTPFGFAVVLLPLRLPPAQGARLVPLGQAYEPHAA